MSTALSTASRVLLLGLLLALVSCGSVRAPKPPAGQKLANPDVLTAGATQVDITPAPGLAIHGQGPAGRVTTGTLLRLRCYPLVLAQGAEVVALVPCDLAWPSFVLQRAVAQALHEAYFEAGHDGSPIGPERILIMGSHAHGAFSHMYPAQNYSGLFSSRDPGFDEDVVRYVAIRIAAGIGTAYENRQPAVAGWAHGSYRDVSKNRSLDAFGNNALLPHEAAEYQPDAGGLLGRRAIDPTLSVLRVDAVGAVGAGGAPIAALAFFGVHGTAVPAINELYESDIFGFANRAFHERCAENLHATTAGVRCPTLGIANGLSGDAGPTAEYPGYREARRLGELLADHVWEVYGQAKPAPAPSGWLDAAYVEVPMSDAPTTNPGCIEDVVAWPKENTTRDTSRLCECPALGMASSGGVEENGTFFTPIEDVYVEASRFAGDPDAEGCHAPKRTLDVFGCNPDAFPRVAPLHAVRLGDAMLTTYPGEVTTVAGRRARERIVAYLGTRATDGASVPRRVVQATHTTEYLQYVATAAEYERQNYEGASTLYGPGSARFFANHQLCLVRALIEGKASSCGLPVDETLELEWSGTKKRDVKVRPRACYGKPRWTSVERATRDGEHGFRAEMRLPEECQDVAQSVRVQVVEAESRKLIATDEGDGVSVRYVTEERPGGCSRAAKEAGGCPYWEIGWFPNARMRAAIPGRPAWEPERILFEVDLERLGGLAFKPAKRRGVPVSDGR